MGFTTSPTATRYYTQDGYVSNNTGAATASNRNGAADAPFIAPVVGISTSAGGSTAGVSPTPISQYLLNSLRALTDYMKRH